MLNWRLNQIHLSISYNVFVFISLETLALSMEDPNIN